MLGPGDGAQIVEVGQGEAVSVLPPCSQKQKAFAARLALGDSMMGAAKYAGIARSTAYEWQDLPQVQAEIARYATIATNNARRMVVGQVREAVRTIRRIMRPGGAAHKGAPTELMAAKLILDYVKIGELPVGATQTRIISRIPRTDDAPADDTLDEIEARYRAEDVPTLQTADGLPPDFARTDSERAGRYAEPVRSIPQELSDPAYYRRSMYRDG